VKADVFRARARNYPSALEASLFRDDIPISVYDNLIAAVRQGVPALVRYYDLRRRALKLDDLHAYDTYVPLVSEIETHISFDQAIDKVVASLAPLGREYVEALRDGLGGRWCDRYETKGKRSGAFSSSSYGAPPYILMNYKEDVFADVYTLAHEAGHSMHTWFAQRSQLFQDYDYPDFPGRSCEHLQRGVAHPLSPRGNDRPENAGLHHQPAGRRSARDIVPPDDVRRI